MPADRYHVSSYPAVCGTCGFTVSRGTDLRRHMKTHLSPEQRAAIEHKCPVTGCEFASLQKSNLNTHLNTHTKHKPYGCPDCSYLSSDPGSLIRHRKRAHKYKPKRHNHHVAPTDTNTPKKKMAIAGSTNCGLDSATNINTPTATSPSTSGRLSLSPPVPPTSANYVSSPVIGPVQELSIPRILVPTRTRSEWGVTLPGVDAMLAGAPHWHPNPRYAPYPRFPLHNGAERHSRASTSTADFSAPSAYTYPPPLPPVEYSRVGRSTSGYGSCRV